MTSATTRAMFVGYEVTTCPDPAQIAAYLARGAPEHHVRRAARVGEDLRRRAARALAADPEKAEQFDDAVEAADADRRGADVGHGHRRGRAPPTSSSTRSRSRTVRALLGLDELRARHHRRGADPGRAARLVPGHRRAAVGGLRHVARTPGPMTLDAVRSQARHGRRRPSPAARCGSAEDGEVICRGGNVFLGYLERPGEDRRGARRRRLAALRRHRRDRRRRLPPIVDRKKELIITAGGKNISPANLEAALKMIPLVGQAVRHRRPAAVRVGARRARPRGRAGVGHAAGHRVRRRSPSWPSTPRWSPRSSAGLERGDGRVQQRRAGEEGARSSARSGCPTPTCSRPTSKLKRRGVMARYDDEIEALYA